MTKANMLLQVPARRAGQVLPGTLAVGDAVIEVLTERTANGGTHSRRFEAAWSKGTAQGSGYIEIRPTSKITTEVAVELERPKGVAGLFWFGRVRRKFSLLFADALAYEIETRSIEEGDAFEVRRTTAELVKARTA